MVDSVALAANLPGLLVMGVVVLVALFGVYKLLERVRRFVVFAALFAVLFLVAWLQGLAEAPVDLAASCSLALTSLGRAALAFIGGNGFSLLPESGGGAGALWGHVLFQLLNLAALALTAETVLSLFTNASSWLSVHFDHFEQVVVVVSSGDMTSCARAFVVDAAHGGTRPRAVFSVVQEGPGDETFRLTSGDTTRTLGRASFQHRLASAIAARATGRIDDDRLFLVVFRNGRVTVTSYQGEHLSKADRELFVSSLAGGAFDQSPVPPDDVYSYSLEEIKVRQLVRRLLPPVDDPGDRGLGLGLKPLTALVIGENVERVVLTVAYLVRNGQALIGAHVDGSAEARRPRIAVASHNASRVERRLRNAYPELFSPSSPQPGTSEAMLTPPAEVTVFDSKFKMLDEVTVCADDLLLVINTEPDTGRAPSQREIWQRRLKLRCPEAEPVFVQYDEIEKPGIMLEDSYGGRVGTLIADAKRVLVYGSATEAMQATRLLHRDLDRMAMLVNLRYSTGPNDPKPSLFDAAQDEPFLADALAAWQTCSAYGRDSSRATADFSPVERLLWQQGIGDLLGSGHGEKNDEALREAIGQLEHLRWNAYLVTTGYRLRAWDTLLERYRAALAANAALSEPHAVQQVFKDVTVDLVNREHAALVDWEYLPELDELFARMGRETGTYDELLAAGRLKPNQQKDRDIVDDLIV